MAVYPFTSARSSKDTKRPLKVAFKKLFSTPCNNVGAFLDKSSHLEHLLRPQFKSKTSNISEEQAFCKKLHSSSFLHYFYIAPHYFSTHL